MLAGAHNEDSKDVSEDTSGGSNSGAPIPSFATGQERALLGCKGKGRERVLGWWRVLNSPLADVLNKGRDFKARENSSLISFVSVKSLPFVNS